MEFLILVLIWGAVGVIKWVAASKERDEELRNSSRQSTDEATPASSLEFILKTISEDENNKVNITRRTPKISQPEPPVMQAEKKYVSLEQQTKQKTAAQKAIRLEKNKKIDRKLSSFDTPTSLSKETPYIEEEYAEQKIKNQNAYYEDDYAEQARKNADAYIREEDAFAIKKERKPESLILGFKKKSVLKKAIIAREVLEPPVGLR